MALACMALGIGLLAVTQAEAAEYFVSPAGADTDPGTIERPFATLAQLAQHAIHFFYCIVDSLESIVNKLRIIFVLSRIDNNKRQLSHHVF